VIIGRSRPAPVTLVAEWASKRRTPWPYCSRSCLGDVGVAEVRVDEGEVRRGQSVPVPGSVGVSLELSVDTLLDGDD
jgi:hypothetical protein